VACGKCGAAAAGYLSLITVVCIVCVCGAGGIDSTVTALLLKRQVSE
jgi:hypothetical protein